MPTGADVVEEIFKSLYAYAGTKQLADDALGAKSRRLRLRREPLCEAASGGE